MKKIIVFGAGGDTGRYFVHYFLEHYTGTDYELVAVVHRETPYFEKMNIACICMDITDRESFSRLPGDVYAVVNLAGAMPARMKGYDPYLYIHTNILGTLNILEYCRENHVDRILFAQSFGDIKDHAEECPLLKVDMPRKFSFKSDHTIYVMSKNFAVDMIENYHQMYGIKPFIFRLPTIYLWSPIDHYYVDGERRKIGYRILIDRAAAGEPIEVWGDPGRVKDMVYVKDFCQMLYKALFADRDRGYYNVGTGTGISLAEQIEGIIEVFSPAGHKSQIVMRPDMPNAPQYIMDIEPACRELGYVPRYDYISMLKDMKNEMERHSREGEDCHVI